MPRGAGNVTRGTALGNPFCIGYTLDCGPGFGTMTI